MAGKPYTEEFELFWKKFPARWNRNLSCYIKRKKRPAFDKWLKLPPEIRAECLAKAKYIKRSEGTPRDCVTWLNQCGWEDIEIEIHIDHVNSFEEKVPNIVNTIKLKPVPEGDKRSTSDKVNEQTNKLKGGDAK